jgi:ubiquinone/menaquinone biosynthesis C-methylase UbiE
MSNDFIKDHWESQARQFGKSHEASWGDEHMIRLEIENIGRHIGEGQEVLDVGCSNGYAALNHLKKNIKRIVGVDFAEGMILQANEAKRELRAQNATFQVGDIRKLPFPDGSFDVVYTTRVLINLPTWEAQVQGIGECIRVARPGGKVLLCEAFWEPLVMLNALRLVVGLPSLVEHDFNRYLKRDRLHNLLKEWGHSYQAIDFSSIYYLGSRFLRELVTNPSDYPGYSNPINALFYDIERQYSGGGMGVQQLYVLEKG